MNACMLTCCVSLAAVPTPASMPANICVCRCTSVRVHVCTCACVCISPERYCGPQERARRAKDKARAAEVRCKPARRPATVIQPSDPFRICTGTAPACSRHICTSIGACVGERDGGYANSTLLLNAHHCACLRVRRRRPALAGTAKRADPAQQPV